MSDPYTSDFDFTTSYLARARMAFAATPRRRDRPRAEFHERMAAHELERFAYYRPGYTEGPEGLGLVVEHHPWGASFSRRDPDRHAGVRIAVNGSEVAYWGRATWWRALWRLVRHTFLAEWHRGLGTVDSVVVPDRSFAVITGLTA